MTTRQAQPANSEQLTMLAVSELPVQFRLDQRTRARGLAHIAAIRRQLAARAAGVTVTAADDTAADTNLLDHRNQAA